ncbi:hypothetical protein QEG98_28380 [Myxococcus sp. MxC21-1]|uniref:hypothetical protein n=1 Tax=Myxococcus sp. MxC21-1 TaxID=3041439 RepID=UPI00292EA47B|nr:hypothetical protein [Myxococcus sp. MxC21-1]WNZ59924.1 hypothetical protein QEG98_28380 [Myxococcus sp. MxC21-1]
MTISVAIKTGSAVVFASDSKVTVSAPTGLDPTGKPVFVSQSYDNAFKIVHDTSQSAMAMFIGAANIGAGSAMSYFSRLSLSLDTTPEKQNSRVTAFTQDVETDRHSYWSSSGLPREKWPGPITILAAPPTGALTPRVWRLDFTHQGTHQEILPIPGVWLEGSSRQAFNLLYGIDPPVIESIKNELEVDEAEWNGIFEKTLIARPVSQINFWTMPLQDAIDFAVLLARTQIEMERFLPGPAVCGGPIDVMVMEMAPTPMIRSFPGKTIRHPIYRGG